MSDDVSSSRSDVDAALRTLITLLQSYAVQRERAGGREGERDQNITDLRLTPRSAHLLHSFINMHVCVRARARHTCHTHTIYI